MSANRCRSCGGRLLSEAACLRRVDDAAKARADLIRGLEWECAAMWLFERAFRFCDLCQHQVVASLAVRSLLLNKGAITQ